MFGKISLIGIATLAALATTANAEKYEWGNVRFDGGGFVSAVMFHPKAENLLYARTDVGGIYRFDFQNKTWIPLMDFISENDKGLYGTEARAARPCSAVKTSAPPGTLAMWKCSPTVTAWAARPAKSSP